EVLDELCLEPHVPIDHFHRFRRCFGIQATSAEHTNPAENGREWRPEFVADRGEKLVLYAICDFRLLPGLARFPQRFFPSLFGFLSLSDVPGDFRCADDRAIAPVDGRDGQCYIDNAAVL